MPPILANTITAGIAASFAYLFILNALIGLLEGRLLRWKFGGGRRAVWWMILANYLSAWTGWLLLYHLLSPHLDSLLGPRPIERINLLAAAILAGAFAVTLFVEAPFVHLACNLPKRRLGRSLLATLCVNAVSYALVSLWFLSTSFTLPLNARVTPLADLGPLPPGTLYHVDPAGNVVARDTAKPATARTVGHVMLNDFVHPYQLRVDRAADNPDRTQLLAVYSTTIYANRPTPPGLAPPDDPTILPDAGPADAFAPDYLDQDRMLRKKFLDLRPHDRRQTRVTFDWYRHMLSTAVPDGPRATLYIGLAGAEWWIQEPTVLPDDNILFEWSGQILLFDPHTRHLAFIATGTCPAFVPAPTR